MTESERIDELLHTVPRPQLTRGQKIGRAIGWVCSAISVVALWISVYATAKAWDTASCVNTLLGGRAPSSQADQHAHIVWAESLAKVVSDSNKAQAMRDYKAFVVATRVYVRTLTDDQAYRDNHPLGKC